MDKELLQAFIMLYSKNYLGLGDNITFIAGLPTEDKLRKWLLLVIASARRFGLPGYGDQTCTSL